MLALTWYAIMLQLLIGIVKLNFPYSTLFLKFCEISSIIKKNFLIPPVERSDIPKASMAVINMELSSPLTLPRMDRTDSAKGGKARLSTIHITHI